jgi:hypothetical protein
MIITGILLSFISVLLLSSSAEQIGYADDNAKFAPISNRLVERNSYDAWGNLREPQTHKVYDAGEAPALMLGRGFTGHEHLQQFGLINMNARLYDPALGRFLSPDPYVQSECGPQGFNRYSYCLNNPLSYVDEDGEFPVLLGVALFGGAANLVYKACSGQIHSIGDAFAAFGIGAVASVAGIATGGWGFGLSGGFIAGAAGFGLGTITDVYLQSLGNNLYFGDPIISTKDLLIIGASSAVAGGIINGSIAAAGGYNFWNGEMIAEGRGIFSLNNSPKPDISMQDLPTAPELPQQPEITVPSKPWQKHHFATNKHKKFTPLMEEITNRYGLSTNGNWNVEALPHWGRHPHDYHRWVLNEMRKINAIPGMNQKEFIRQFRINIIEPVKMNPDMLYKKYWRLNK